MWKAQPSLLWLSRHSVGAKEARPSGGRFSGCTMGLVPGKTGISEGAADVS